MLSPTPSQAARFATLQTCHQPQILSLFSCSTSKMIRIQINTMAGLRCWRCRAVPPGRWISTKPQPAKEARPVSPGHQPHCGDPSPITLMPAPPPPGHTAQQQLPAPRTGRFTAGAARSLERAAQVPAAPEQTPSQVSVKLSLSMGQFGVFYFSVFKPKTL